MKKRKQKIRRRFRVFFIILVIFILGVCLLHFYKNQYKNDISEWSTFHDSNIVDTNLSQLNYTEEDINFLKKELSSEHINYLIEHEIDSKMVMHIIKETYYIDAYLEKYITYSVNHSSMNAKEIVTRVNVHIDTEFYTDTEKTDDTLGKFVILNKHYYSDENYKGKDLVSVNAKYNLYGNTFQLSQECYDAFLKMYNDAEEAGFGFKINSAYRSFEKQVSIYQGWVNKDGEKLADTYSARAGYSEHQTGYAFDIRDFPFTNDDYSKTKSFTWVSQNAQLYGFIIRFPKDKEYITGYQYEPWHYRYCGLECAQYIYEHNITFEEYYEYFIRFKNPRHLS